MRPRIATLGALIVVLLAASLLGCGGNKSTSSVTPPPTKELDSGTLANGGVYMHTFANAGTYNYHCTIHGLTMAGSVSVASGPTANASVSIGNNFYNPPSVSVAPNGTVTWTNNGVPHTVTSN